MRFFFKTIVCALFLFSSNGWSQKAVFKHFDKTEGLTNSFIYNINQDKRGFLWIGTGNGFYCFDGLHFTQKKDNDYSIKLVTTTITDKLGTLWIGHDNGFLSIYDGSHFNLLNKTTSFESDIRSIVSMNNYQCVCAQNGSIRLYDAKNKFININDLKDKITLLSVLAINEKQLFIGTDAGLLVCEIDFATFKITEVAKIAAIPSSNISTICKSSEGKYFVATKDEGFYNLYYNTTNPSKSVVSSISSQFNLELWNIDYLFQDKKKNLWVGSNDQGLYCFIWNDEKQNFDHYNQFNKSNGLPTSSIRYVFEDSYSNMWLGTFGEGLFGLFDNAIGFVDVKNYVLSSDIYSVAKGSKSIWLGVLSNIVELNKQFEVKSTINLSSILPDMAISAVCADSLGNLWIGTKRNGLLKYNIEKKTTQKILYSENTTENYISAIILDNNTIWMATNGGVIQYNISTGAKNVFSTNTGLPHNKINSIYKDLQGTIWIATKSNSIVAVNKNKFHRIDGNLNIEFTDIVEDKNGSLWATTAGNGVFNFRNDKLINFSTANGLFSDYCYSLTSDKEGNVWVGHRKGISKITSNKNKIIVYDHEVGVNGDCNLNAVATTDDAVFFGSTNGLVVFNTNKLSQQQIAPLPEIISIKVSDKEIDSYKDVVMPYGKYSFRFEFIGLNFSQPTSVKYQYKLEGWDVSWSELTGENWVFYPRLDDGKYTFLVKTFTAEGNESKKILSIQVEVKMPFWKKWWFQLLIVLIVLATFYAIVIIRERRQRHFQLHLQGLLDDRTVEVTKQKQELEYKNKDITDSINYARRIQSSMLPSIDKLINTFSQSFVVYFPRDIVSGDFYWFNQYNNKLVMLCADATGHGVPGAFMSIIGITLIKEICGSNEDFSPAMLLHKLDVELQNTINQNHMVDKSSDGMDASLIEVNLSTFDIRIASAMRPVIIFRNGELVNIEGSKSTIGSTPMLHLKKDFVESTIKLSKGDAIYLFTDGITDQFGGPSNKKFRTNKLKALLLQINKKPMKEQKEIIEETFRIWKGDHDQVDDVLMIGLRL